MRRRQEDTEARRHDGAAASKHAMTLVEILAVVVILGLIAGTLLVGFSGTFGKAKHELAKSGIGVVVSKLELYRIERSAWPGNDLGLARLSDGYAVPTDSYYLGPDKLIDPWGNPYLYLTPGPNGHPYEVVTYGADGQPGGEGENADISSSNLRVDD
jgi:general secretion pathway protein G